MKYVALLRGINVGGNNKVGMSELRVAVEELGYANVRTYINSGNVLFETNEISELKLAEKIEAAIESTFKLPVKVAVINEIAYQKIVADVPKGWGEKEGWKYNTLFLLPPYKISKIMEDIGELKPDIEQLIAGDGVIYQAILFEKFGRTTSGKLAAKAAYKQMTVRNWNTTRKLLTLLETE